MGSSYRQMDMTHLCSTNIFFLIFFFLMWTIFKVFIEFDILLHLFYVLSFFGHKACGILAPQPGKEPTPPALEGEVLSTVPAGKSLH